jgi:hypothetical protein
VPIVKKNLEFSRVWDNPPFTLRYAQGERAGVEISEEFFVRAEPVEART